MKEAQFYEKLEGNRVRCGLCSKLCSIKEGEWGFCQTRQNLQGTLYANYYAQVCSINNDPIEKKPLYHFYPGREILSIASNGCNLKCQFCQNWQISQGRAPTKSLTPVEAVTLAQKYKSLGIAYTYTEPLIWYEYVLETSKLIHEAGLKNVLVTNGEINEEPLKQLLPFIDAMNVDVKSMSESFYRKVCYGTLEPVLRTVEMAKDYCHVEVTNLVIPTLNDSSEDFQKLSTWLASLDENIPLHFSRYFPQYKMDLPATPEETLARARKIALEKLKYVYVGNIPKDDWDDTYCPRCRKKIIARKGYMIQLLNYDQGKCGLCHFPLNFKDD
ncbi:MAG: AmmeMemoRadiSam system radical SAM enzyme [Candidatus Tectomicrobia bacterium]|uniref:AmmeMemoRadiSam system radical SAM enzyme n=1 Tax=Tectimicrobiota bacterium TaxID=2528274 RepID=A0A933GNB7_UNCTE|nr:AmmeMemoRadiSam system radical SAM enzyme [Candidatus Tectomicrobia bacterium]